ncbi:MAG: hypothetical protein WA726_10160 [Acidimicrobiia bacterium]
MVVGDVDPHLCVYLGLVRRVGGSEGGGDVLQAGDEDLDVLGGQPGGGGPAEEGFEPASLLVGLGDPLGNGRGGFRFGAHDGAVAVEFLVELVDPLPDLALLCFLVGVGLGGSSELGAGVVEVLVGEQFGDPIVEAGDDAVFPNVDGRRVVRVVGGVVAVDLAAEVGAVVVPGAFHAATAPATGESAGQEVLMPVLGGTGVATLVAHEPGLDGFPLLSSD